MVSLPLLALLLLGMASAISVSSRSMPDGTTSGSASLQAAAAIDQMATELSYATSITSRSSTSIVFVSPDRTGDTISDNIAYNWSGTAGAPLLRTVNGGAAEEVIRSAGQFTVTYDAPVDAALGVPLLKSAGVRVVAPATATMAIDVSIPVHNRPSLP